MVSHRVADGLGGEQPGTMLLARPDTESATTITITGLFGQPYKRLLCAQYHGELPTASDLPQGRLQPHPGTRNGT